MTQLHQTANAFLYAKQIGAIYLFGVAATAAAAPSQIDGISRISRSEIERTTSMILDRRKVQP